MSNVVVFGGAGFIGSHVVDELCNRGNQVLVVDNLAAGSAENLVNSPSDLLIADPTTDIGFIRVARDVQGFRPTHIIDLAAEPYIPDSYASVDWSVGAFRSNVNLVTASARIGLQNLRTLQRYLYISTSEVYGSAVGMSHMDESHRLNPQSTYAVSKLAAERLIVNWYFEHGLPAVILRQFNTYGPRSTHPYVIPHIITQMSKPERVVRLGDISVERDFLYVTDAATRIVDSLFGNLDLGDVYNSGYGDTYSIGAIFNVLHNIVCLSESVHLIPNYKPQLRPNDVKRLLCCSDKLCGRIGYPPLVSLGDGLQRTYEYFTQRGKWLWEK